ncbi:TPA: hypothetical protein KPJ62_003894 [Clostridioides difficile]|nr:hypothetical protein [Clostridioides difficile]
MVKDVIGEYSIEILLKKYRQNITDEWACTTKFGIIHSSDWSYIILCYATQKGNRSFRLVRYSNSISYSIRKYILGYDFKQKAERNQKTRLRLLLEYEKAYSSRGLNNFTRIILNEHDLRINGIFESHNLSVKNTKYKNNNHALLIGYNRKYIKLIFRVNPNSCVMAIYTFMSESVLYIIDNFLGDNFKGNIDRVKNEKIKLLVNVIKCLNNSELR